MILYAGFSYGKDITHTYFIRIILYHLARLFDQNLDGFDG
jgi:hypothetical protein